MLRIIKAVGKPHLGWKLGLIPGTLEFQIGFALQVASVAYILIILCQGSSYVHLSTREIGFVLHFYTCLGGIWSWDSIGFVLQGAVGVNVLIILVAVSG